MSGRPRRSVVTAALLKKEKEIKKEEEEDEESRDIKEEEHNGEGEDDDGPPPLEREESCGENDDTDGEGKDDDKGGFNLLKALSSVFGNDNEKKNGPPMIDHGSMKFLSSTPLPARGGPIPKSLLLKKASTSAASVPATRFTSVRQMNAIAGTSTSSENRKYGLPPPIPPSLRNLAASITPAVVGSNTNLGPAKLLENRKRQIEHDFETNGTKRTSLVAYNGGRAGEKFQKIPTLSELSKSSRSNESNGTAAFDVSSLFRDQSPVRMQVSVGGDQDNGDSMQEALEMAVTQKETIGSIAKASSNHSILLGSMVLNGLNTLQSKSSEEYNNFAGDLFALITKYNIQ